jgi:hypothetical protein
MLNSNYYFENIDDIDKWRLIALIMLESQMKKPIPLNEKWLLKKISNNERSMSETIRNLDNFIQVTENDNVTSNDSKQENSVPKSRVEKSRVEYNRIESQPPAELSKQPFEEPTTEQKQTLAKLHATLSKPPYKFNLFMYMKSVNKKLGYFPPVESIINISNTAIKNKKTNLWGYFNNALKEEFPKKFADLNEKKGKVYKNEPANIGEIMRRAEK